MRSAVVVGSGPNGLTGAVTLAAAGYDVTVLEANDTVGGGLRSDRLRHPGLVHDTCAGFHPFTRPSAFARRFGLPGLTWAWPEVQVAHPLDDGRGAHVLRSVAGTADTLGRDAAAYRRLWEPLVDRFEDLFAEIMRPVAHLPRHPFTLGRFGTRAALSAGAVARLFRSEEARALWAGLAAHSFRPLAGPFSAAAGLALGAASHAEGWPVAVGGTGAIADSLVALLASFGGRVETGVRVSELPRADVVLLDTAPGAAAAIVGDRMPRRVHRSYARFRHGAAAHQVLLAVEGGVPWAYEPARRAGTVHLGGTFAEVADAERSVARGAMPERPFVLVGQQYLADPSRSDGDLHPVDAYAHVPAGHAGAGATDRLLDQIERFAPGFRAGHLRDVVVRTPADIEAADANFVGGDIATGDSSPGQLLLGPHASLDPYATGVPGVYLCSAATPPGPGAHGIPGHRAALRALRRG